MLGGAGTTLMPVRSDDPSTSAVPSPHCPQMWNASGTPVEGVQMLSKPSPAAARPISSSSVRLSPSRPSNPTPMIMNASPQTSVPPP